MNDDDIVDKFMKILVYPMEYGEGKSRLTRIICLTINMTLGVALFPIWAPLFLILIIASVIWDYIK